MFKSDPGGFKILGQRSGKANNLPEGVAQLLKLDQYGES